MISRFVDNLQQFVDGLQNGLQEFTTVCRRLLHGIGTLCLRLRLCASLASASARASVRKETRVCVCVSIRVGFAVMAVLPPKLLWCVCVCLCVRIRNVLSRHQMDKKIQHFGRYEGNPFFPPSPNTMLNGQGYSVKGSIILSTKRPSHKQSTL